jgi:hypothetical protein
LDRRRLLLLPARSGGGARRFGFLVVVEIEVEIVDVGVKFSSGGESLSLVGCIALHCIVVVLYYCTGCCMARLTLLRGQCAMVRVRETVQCIC